MFCSDMLLSESLDQMRGCCLSSVSSLENSTGIRGIGTYKRGPSRLLITVERSVSERLEGD